MVDVKVHKCFPTVIYEFEHKLHDKIMMETYIKQVRKNHMYHTDDDLHVLSYFSDLREFVKLVSKQYLNDLQYEYEKLEITGMWANKLHEGEAHPPHTHSNNVLSGVYYLSTSTKTSPIQFFDPRVQAHILKPRNKTNWNNASMVQFDSIEGKGYIFPSWLQHWVPPTVDERISISWNILVRGNYGEPNTLQNAHI
jgi:uncharacterized protein (TIGR02466 family)